jgi:hypothetical protein
MIVEKGTFLTLTIISYPPARIIKKTGMADTHTSMWHSGLK